MQSRDRRLWRRDFNIKNDNDNNNSNNNNEQLTTCESALSADKTIPHKTGLVRHVSGLCPSSVTNGLDIGRSAIVDNRVEELRWAFILCVANVSRLLKLRARGG